jgi:micrococcal nuclease
MRFSVSNIAAVPILVVSLFAQAVVCDDRVDQEVQEVKVIDVVDGTTIIVLYADNPITCSYIGVSTPESDNPLRPTGSEARQFNKDMVAGKTVRLEFDEQRYDKYGRLLAYVYCDDVFVNAELIRQGYGSVMIISPNTRHAEHFLKLESEAREAKRGLWAEPGEIVAPTQSIASLEEQIGLLARKIDELSSKIDQLVEIIRELQSQPKDAPLAVSHLERKEANEKAHADLTEEQSDQTVYITRSGGKYHKPGCRFLTEGYMTITLEEAKRRGLQPCKICFPEEAK